MPAERTLPRIEILDKSLHDRAGFSCGVAALDAYLQKQASQDVEKRAAVAYVAMFEPPEIAGYYTLSQFSIEFTNLPERLSKKLARYPFVPATLMGRLAVATGYRGRGLGRDLLFDALWRSLQQSASIASAGVVVDAKDETAVAFYGKYGFEPIFGASRRLFLAMRAVEQMFPHSGA